MEDTASNQKLTVVLSLIVLFLLISIITVYYVAVQTGNSPVPETSPAPTPIAVVVTPTIPQFPPAGLSQEELNELLFPYIKHAVTLTDTGFTPIQTDAVVDDRIRWVNESETSHTLTFNGISYDLGQNEEVSFLLDTAGDYPFTISGYDVQEGNITVSPK